MNVKSKDKFLFIRGYLDSGGSNQAFEIQKKGGFCHADNARPKEPRKKVKVYKPIKPKTVTRRSGKILIFIRRSFDFPLKSQTERSDQNQTHPRSDRV